MKISKAKLGTAIIATLASATVISGLVPRALAQNAPAPTAPAQLAAAAPAPAPAKPQAEAQFTVLPINNAKFLVGQRFDFKAELTGVAEGFTQFSATIDGNPLKSLFGQEPVVDAKGGTISLKQVSFDKPGKHEVIVTLMTADYKYFTKTVRYEVVDAQNQQAKNVVLFIGDGLSLPIRTAARIVSRGLSEGKANNYLEMDTMDVASMVITSGMDSVVTDSANSASAYATGHKSAVNAMGVYPDATPDPTDDPKVENILELAKRTRGMSTGIVSTANITDATPAAFVAHTRRRSEQNFIADSMLNPASMPDVILGGGARHFIPQSANGSRRKDDRNLIDEFKKAGYTFAGNRQEMKAGTGADKILGLFQMDNMDVYLDREYYKKPEVLGSFKDQPTLWEMTDTAINTLSKNPKGFFLMVEGASVDKQAHNLDFERTVWDTIEFDKAVGTGKRYAEEHKDTLVIVVADHSHSMSITGTYWEGDGKTGNEAVRTYADSKFPTYVDSNGDGFPDTPNVDRKLAVGWGNHPDYFENYQPKDAPISAAVMGKEKKAVANPQFGPGGTLMPGNLPSGDTSEVHTADDVPLTAMGPGARYFKPVSDNTEVFYAMVQALGLGGQSQGQEQGHK